MNELEEKLSEIDQLVTKSTETEEFFEPQLEPAVHYVFDNSDSVTQKDMPRVKELFRRLAAMNKSTPFGCGLYRRLGESSFEFAEEVLREAVDTEPYYNCNDAALKSYVAVALRRSDVPEDVCEGLLQNIPGGHHFYVDILRKVGDARPSAQIEIPDELKTNLIAAASRDKFEQTRGKALCALVYFNVTTIVPTLKDRLLHYAQQTDKLNFDILAEITTTATALEYLTGNKRYRQLVDFCIPEMQLMINTPYTQEFIQNLDKKLKEFK